MVKLRWLIASSKLIYDAWLPINPKLGPIGFLGPNFGITPPITPPQTPPPLRLFMVARLLPFFVMLLVKYNVRLSNKNCRMEMKQSNN